MKKKLRDACAWPNGAGLSAALSMRSNAIGGGALDSKV